jgi:hypothetical protein
VTALPALSLLIVALTLVLAGCGARLDNFGPHDPTPTPVDHGADYLSLRWLADADSQLAATLMTLSIEGKRACRYSSDPAPNDTYVIRACLNRPGEDNYVWIWDPSARILDPISDEAKALLD